MPVILGIINSERENIGLFRLVACMFKMFIYAMAMFGMIFIGAGILVAGIMWYEAKWRMIGNEDPGEEE